MKKFLFICGTPRSGTSYMATIIGSHPRIVMGVERFSSRYGNRSLRPEHFSKERFFNLQPGDTTHSESTVFFKQREMLFDKFDDCEFVGDKYPNMIKNLGWIKREFTDPAFIFVIRNPVSVARSWAVRAQNPRDKWPDRNGFEAAFRFWSDSIARAVDARDSGCKIIALDYDLAVSASADEVHAHLDNVFMLAGAEPSPAVHARLMKTKMDSRSSDRIEYTDDERTAAMRMLQGPSWSGFLETFAADGFNPPAWARDLGTP